MAEQRSIAEQLLFEIDPCAPPCDFDAALAKFLLGYVRTPDGGNNGAENSQIARGQRTGDSPK